MTTPHRLTSPPHQPPSSSAVVCAHIRLLAAGANHPFGQMIQGRFAPSPLARWAREFWRNLPLDYPEFGFDQIAILPDRIELLVIGPMGAGRHPLLRGIMAHFKALLTRAAGWRHTIWRPGYEIALLVPATSAAIARRRFRDSLVARPVEDQPQGDPATLALLK